MDLTQLRFDNNEECCRSILYVNEQFFGFIIEDSLRLKKLPGVTAIPKGKYEIKFRKEQSEKTRQYREKFDWFTWHLHLQSVPNYEYVYIHVGNTARDSRGCLLVNNIAYADANKMGQSTDSFRKLYTKVKAALEKEEKVIIDIREVSGLKYLDE